MPAVRRLALPTAMLLSVACRYASGRAAPLCLPLMGAPGCIVCSFIWALRLRRTRQLIAGIGPCSPSAILRPPIQYGGLLNLSADATHGDPRGFSAACQLVCADAWRRAGPGPRQSPHAPRGR